MTDAQAWVIIKFVSSHSSLAFNKAVGCNPKETKSKLWNKLKDLVNGTGGPQKTDDQIQTVSVISLTGGF